MTDFEIVEGLIARDPEVTRVFFFVNCKPLIYSIISKVYRKATPENYDDMVNDLYLHLMENDAARLRQYGGRSSIYQWLKTVGIRYFIQKRKGMIDSDGDDSLYFRTSGEHTMSRVEFEMDLDALIERVKVERYRQVLRLIFIEDCSVEDAADRLGVTAANYYNIKHRAMQCMLREAKLERYE